MIPSGISSATKFVAESVLELTPNKLYQQLNPETILRDDPLRVLRVIRFASRFGWKIDPELAKVMKRVNFTFDL
jgi:tRNA nucleotidyltransferase (CCA-adding enzyme)